MRSATERLPSLSTLLTSWVTNGEPYTGWEISGLLGAGPLRGMSALLLLRPVAATGLLAVLHTLRVQRATNDLVANARQVLHPATTHEHHRVLLQVVPLARDVRRDLDATGQLHASDLAQRRVGLLGRGGVDAGAHAAPLRTPLESRSLLLGDLVLPALADKLLDRWHRPAFSCVDLVVPRASVSRGRACRPGSDPRRTASVPNRCSGGL